jgi:hypothetical protein
MQSKTFIGTYYDNEMAIRKYIANSDYRIIAVHRDKNIVKHDYNLKHTAARKQQKTVVFYYHDNALTRALGFRPMPAHFMYR